MFWFKSQWSQVWVQTSEIEGRSQKRVGYCDVPPGPKMSFMGPVVHVRFFMDVLGDPKKVHTFADL